MRDCYQCDRYMKGLKLNDRDLPYKVPTDKKAFWGRGGGV